MPQHPPADWVFVDNPVKVENTTSNDDTTPSDNATNTADTSPGSYISPWLFDEDLFRDRFVVPFNGKIMMTERNTGLKLLRDNYPERTGSSVIVEIKTKADKDWNYAWSVIFCARPLPNQIYNVNGTLKNYLNMHCEVYSDALLAALPAISRFVAGHRNANPPYSNFYIRIPQFAQAEHAIHKYFANVERGVPLRNDDEKWYMDVHMALAQVLNYLRQLDDQGIQVRLWHKDKG
ncbi:hypothetical protein FBEOM_4182 [Fusarium beomiforme]|uniref:Uncharacterized protein n=1 Tax=Fusarium beomiforme TaxID=44412 RepID=A0A9P5ANK2_9HYPO|nr:hypothetical protein FBEOM_4182 [Fusarium beomiforme]